jgi:hypothetical protein
VSVALLVDVVTYPWIECLTDGAAWCNRCDQHVGQCLPPPAEPIPLEDWLARLRLFLLQHADCEESAADDGPQRAAAR